jgi:predicted NAD/FAD-dependent oxidoreductase
VSDASFQLLVDQWVHAGWAEPWAGRVGRVDASDGAFTPAPPQPRYLGVGGNRMLAQRIAADWCDRRRFLPARRLQ